MITDNSKLKNWRKVKLGEVAVLNPLVRLEKGKNYSFIPMEDIDGIGKYVEPTIYKEFNGGGARFNENDVLFARITPCLEHGKVAVAKNLKKGVGFGSTEYFALRGKENLSDTNFLYYLSRTSRFKQTAINSMAGASGRQRAKIEAISSFELNFPSFNEQKRIAKTLSVLDDKIELNNKISKNLEQTAQVIFKEWFVNFKFPDHEKVKMVDSEMGKIPEEWKVKKIKDVAKINKGLSYSSEEIKENNGGVPMINLANFVRGGGFKIEGIKFFSGKYKDSNLVKPGDIVIALTDLTSNREVIGHPARVPEIAGWDKILISLDVCSLETQEILKTFLYYLMLRREFSYLMASSASGTNVSHLNKSVIEEYSFCLPPEELLEKFCTIVNSIFMKANKLVSENKKLAALRDLLLPKLMSGEIRV